MGHIIICGPYILLWLITFGAIGVEVNYYHAETGKEHQLKLPGWAA